MSEPSIAHGTFVIERRYPADPARVFRAWSDPAIKQKWFGDGTPAQIFEFREGGREFKESVMGDTSFVFDVNYRDIVENHRIIYAYEMHMNGRRISASLAAVEFFPDNGGTRLTITEYGCFLDGLDTVDQRRAGTEMLVKSLGDELSRQMAS
jgi:uncharacterized protein YndB with AHSA1/START domain